MTGIRATTARIVLRLKTAARTSTDRTTTAGGSMVSRAPISNAAVGTNNTRVGRLATSSAGTGLGATLAAGEGRSHPTGVAAMRGARTFWAANHRTGTRAPARDRHPLAQEPSGHEPFSHSAFGESERPRYFGTGAQGHGGGPSFTGGTYGTADWRSDAPHFDEVGFNRGNYEDPLPRERELRSRQSGYGQSHQQRRYPMGPKGYMRSDERLREDISERLMQAYDIDSSEVTVQVQGGKVVLEGTVPNRVHETCD